MINNQFDNTIVKLLGKVQNKLAQASKQFCHQKVIFLHIPKCGGTSIGTAIASGIGADTKGFIDPIQTREITQEILGKSSEGSALLLQLRQAILLENYLKDEPYIFGHFPIVRKVLNEPKDYFLVTVLREPVERFISQFQYYLATRKLKNTQFLSLEDIETLWQDYIHSNLAKFHANTLSIYLNDQISLVWGNDKASNRAIENLKYFHLIGFLDRLENFTAQFYSLVGTEINISTKNKTSNQLSIDQYKLLNLFIEDKYRCSYDTIKEMCHFDLKIYNFAKENFMQRIK